MNTRVLLWSWLLVAGIQTVLLTLVLVLLTARGGAAAPLGTAPSDATSAAQPPPVTVPVSLTLQEARIIIEASIARARELNGRAAVVVVDASAQLISADRMDGAALQMERLATGKALGAVHTRRRTAEAVPLLTERPDRYFGILNMFPGQVYLVPGGAPLLADRRLVGAVGAAGLGPGEDDQAIDAGIAAWERFRRGGS